MDVWEDEGGFVPPADPRPDWDQYFLGIARAVAARGDCRRRQVGAVVVRDRRIVSTGYNGTAPGAEGCLVGACPRGLMSNEEQAPNTGYANCTGTHAEANALIWCPVRYREGSVVYSTEEPCPDCQTLMRAMGVVNCVYPGGLWYS